MIDDHPLQIDAYKSILAYNNPGHELEITAAYDCAAAYQIITEDPPGTNFDFVFLDYNLPPYPEQKIVSGEDLGYLIKEYMPHTRLVIITSHFEAFLLQHILKKLDPKGLLVKSDITGPDLLDAFDILLDYKNYYSETVTKILTAQIEQGRL